MPSQLSLPFIQTKDVPVTSGESYLQRLVTVLSSDLDFHDQDGRYASHNLHSFPAKFPPQLPRVFINNLTEPEDVVLDPMMGSGTTVLEALLGGRKAIGFDIDPNALLISKVKTGSLNVQNAANVSSTVAVKAFNSLEQVRSEFDSEREKRWDKKTRSFIDYWFAIETQIELLALLKQIEKVKDESLRSFLALAFSAIIITKSGGVSLAFDLAHTRPHRAKIVYDQNGKLILGHEYTDKPTKRTKLLTKTLRSPILEFEKRTQQNLKGILSIKTQNVPARISFGNAECLPLESESVDLIVTSPPYASNAIDYMRAHKFSLVWLGYSIDELSTKRQSYIGADGVSGTVFEEMPQFALNIVSELSRRDEKKARVLHRYYSEMTRVLREMYRVLRPGKAAIVVVGTSIMRDVDTQTHECLAAIGRKIGFEVPKIGIRYLDRNRRMMPAGMEVDRESQIQQRMHEEYIIGFYKE